ncbi:hypothetical protein ABNL11_004962 [Klebsiella pneumoniae]|nr:hypothetical protein [Salmonella enterica]EMD7130151.1 hypothetical protein [Salmonella enterica]BBW89477.1 hypothetical protein THOKLE017_P30140 [Klebsiella pneumoniae]
MFEKIQDGFSFLGAAVLSLIILGTLIAALWYYFLSDARHNSFHSGGLIDFMDALPEWLMYSIFVDWFISATIPMLNFIADQKQYGGVVGAAREMGMFGERPWYGVGGYQFLILVAVLVIGYLINRYRNH